AFALTLAYLGEQCSAMDAGGAFSAYITGNVASNLVGRLISAAVADTLGLASNFYFFALLNLAGAVLVYFTIQRVQPMHAMATTLFAGKAVARFGTRPSIWAALAVAAIGLPLMLSSHLAEVLTGMVLVGVGTFFAQACATGFVGQAAHDNRGVASGTYLACYFLGGLAGSAVLGQLFDRFGWAACVAGVGAALAVAAILTTRLVLTP